MDKNNKDAAKLISSAILGLDMETVIIADKSYNIFPPTIAKLAGAAYWLSDFSEIKSVKDIFANMKSLESAAHALSWFINGDDTIAETLMEGTMPEVVSALESAFKLIETENFIKLSALMKSARMLTAKQR